MTKTEKNQKSKFSVKTPWGNLVKSSGVEEQFELLILEIEKLNKKINDLEISRPSQSSDLPELPGTTSSSEDIKKVERRVEKVENDLNEIREKLTQIKDKFTILSQQIIKKIS